MSLVNLQKLQDSKPWEETFESDMFFIASRNLSGSQEKFYCNVSLVIAKISLSENFVNLWKANI